MVNKVNSKYNVWLYILIILCVVLFYICINGVLLYDFNNAEFKEVLIILGIVSIGILLLPYLLYKKLIKISVDDHKVYLSNIFQKTAIFIKDLSIKEGDQFTRYGAPGEYFIITDQKNNKKYKIEKFSIKNYDEILRCIKQNEKFQTKIK